jgi:hypothetical protein
MTITNGLITLADFQAYMKGSNTAYSVDLADDAVQERQIEAASAVIESLAGRSFLCDTDDISYLDVPKNVFGELLLDKDYYSIASVVNGDGTTLDTDDYLAMPANSTPKYALRLKYNAGVAWSMDNQGNPLGAITVTGVTGYGATVPADIAEACKELTRELFLGRFGSDETSTEVVTAAGVVKVPSGILDRIQEIVRNKRRVGFG